MNKLILITVLALAGMNNARSIGITLDRIQFSVGTNEIELYPPFSRFHMDNEANPFLNPNYAIDWRFTNTQESASLEGGWYVRGAGLTSGATVYFTLAEPVDFSLTGWIRQPEWLPDSFTSLGAILGPYEINASVLDVGGASPDLFGTLNIGQYIFRTNGYAFNTESNSSIHLLLTPVATPDGGSTLMLMGLALGIIGILRLPKAHA